MKRPGSGTSFVLTYEPEVPCHRTQFFFFTEHFVDQLDNIVNIAINSIVRTPILSVVIIACNSGSGGRTSERIPETGNRSPERGE